MDQLFKTNNTINVNLDSQTLSFNDKTVKFEIDAERKRRLIEGLDDIGLTLQYEDEIKSFEKQYLKKYSWI